VSVSAAPTWLLLLDLLGLDDVCNYDGSWTERGSVTGMPSSSALIRGLPREVLRPQLVGPPTHFCG
jgi:hypothetical protein